MPVKMECLRARGSSYRRLELAIGHESAAVVDGARIGALEDDKLVAVADNPHCAREVRGLQLGRGGGRTRAAVLGRQPQEVDALLVGVELEGLTGGRMRQAEG